MLRGKWPSNSIETRSQLRSIARMEKKHSFIREIGFKPKEKTFYWQTWHCTMQQKIDNVKILGNFSTGMMQGDYLNLDDICRRYQ